MPSKKSEQNEATLKFKQRKTTKGTVVFEEIRTDDERPHVFYMLNRLHDQLGSPDQIVMTVEID